MQNTLNITPKNNDSTILKAVGYKPLLEGVSLSEMENTETWKGIVDYEGLYSVNRNRSALARDKKHLTVLKYYTTKKPISK